ncbi:acyltransferase family protein [Oricola nitratireducens]|uniref:acyltransferase family protein n=1 Tax=Oricola nitratireducens TaxID=2775868 RepID=UPI001867A7E0|nr:acyltransferase [Oricola nitratireducens]
MTSINYSTVSSDLPATKRRVEKALPIETVRIIATILLVTYHVIGSSPSYGLEVDYPHPARLFADFFVDLRMPLFAFISGLVFAIRPIRPPELPRFMIGKVRRLIVPGTVAIFLSVIAVKLVDTHFEMERPLWQFAVFPYLHYWFLMSIFLIFVIYAPLDAWTRGKSALPVFLCSLVLYESGWKPEQNVFSIYGAIYLLPYFLLGVLFHRNVNEIFARTGLLIPLAFLAVAAASYVNVSEYLDTGRFSVDNRDLQSLAFGFGACMLAMMTLPRISILARFGPYSYTIYLYHVFATSFARRGLTAAGIEDSAVFIAVGVVCGLALPVLLHVVAKRFPLTRVAMLGLRWRPDANHKRI